MPTEIRKNGDVVTIALDGRLALGGPVDDFRNNWMEAIHMGAKTVIVDLTRVPMVDSSGIGTMIRCHSAVTAAGAQLKIVGANSVVRQSFRITRLDKVFEFYETEAQALTS